MVRQSLTEKPQQQTRILAVHSTRIRVVKREGSVLERPSTKEYRPGVHMRSATSFSIWELIRAVAG